ncbi:uncharacterized protein PpBr36_09642 [Pyricularia pennisetigena]|uniref:uncharacterized protein n=1 Tax=Pyricularia pennisetigena TaxID=1578925 RepID=UPI00114DAD9A|nr:uncharacterized protein PpBr36_09642 [Pyricularia pennisetigena]TLS21629.1 hypothetical protein PpBr36_09642 [Pyricularia pennisetigena]
MNIQVHYPLLRLAAKICPGVKTLPVTTARMSKHWMPPMVGAGVSSEASSSGATTVTTDTEANEAAAVVGKMVDFIFVFDESVDTQLGAAIRKVLRKDKYLSINYSDYGPIRFRPTGIPIETKISSVADSGRTQLLIWAAGWFARMEAWVRKQQRVNAGTEIKAPCELVQATLDADTRFKALSYTWGNPQDTKPILLDGEQVQVTSNLEAYLQQLCHPTEKHWHEEEAESYCCFLEDDGQPPRVFDDLLGTLMTKFHQILSAAADSPELLGIADVLGRDWFTRVWVMQGLAMAGRVSFRIGAADIGLGRLYLACFGFSMFMMRDWRGVHALTRLLGDTIEKRHEVPNKNERWTGLPEQEVEAGNGTTKPTFSASRSIKLSSYPWWIDTTSKELHLKGVLLDHIVRLTERTAFSIQDYTDIDK